MNDNNQTIILLVDDSISFHTMIDMFLRQSAIRRYGLVSTTTAEDMFEIVEKNSDIDIILLDISLPGANGLVACKQLRSRYPDLPVIIITAKLDKQLMQAASEAGAADFLLKPFDGASLRARISHALSSRVVVE